MSVNPLVYIATTANTSSLNSYTNDAAFVNAKGSAAAEGDIYTNTTLHVVRAYLNGGWKTQRFLTDPLSKTHADSGYTITSNDGFILWTLTNASNDTATLPACSDNAGKVLIIKLAATTAAFNTLTVSRAGSDTITLSDGTTGATSLVFHTGGETYELVSDGTSVWHVTNHKTNTAWTSYTPTGASSTNTTYTGYWRRIGDTLEVNALITYAGVPDAVSQTVSWPSGLTFDTAKVPIADEYGVLGICGLHDNSSTFGYTGFVAYDSGVQVRLYGYDTVVWSRTVPITIASGDRTSANFKVPISGWKA